MICSTCEIGIDLDTDTRVTSVKEDEEPEETDKTKIILGCYTCKNSQHYECIVASNETDFYICGECQQLQCYHCYPDLCDECKRTQCTRCFGDTYFNKCQECESVYCENCCPPPTKDAPTCECGFEYEHVMFCKECDRVTFIECDELERGNCEECDKEACYENCLSWCEQCEEHYCQDHINKCSCGSVLCQDHIIQCNKCNKSLCDECAMDSFNFCEKCEQDWGYPACEACVSTMSTNYQCESCEISLCKECERCGFICTTCERQTCRECEACSFSLEDMNQCARCVAIESNALKVGLIKKGWPDDLIECIMKFTV